MIKDIIILGTGGNSVDILDAINEINSISIKFNCIGFLDDDISKKGSTIFGVEVLGSINQAKQFPNAYFVNGIGNTKNFTRKQEIIKRSLAQPHRFETIIHPSASVSSLSKIGKGSVIFQNVTVCSNVEIGMHVVILPNSIISHDVKIKNYSVIAGGVCISGGTIIGQSTYIGTNSSIRENLSIGNNCLIGMSSNVLSNAADNTIYFGNPAREKKIK
jgi:sugar O-acyltransferase (sialic acid O-acetyltransferase NeuD family)